MRIKAFIVAALAACAFVGLAAGTGTPSVAPPCLPADGCVEVSPHDSAALRDALEDAVVRSVIAETDAAISAFRSGQTVTWTEIETPFDASQEDPDNPLHWVPVNEQRYARIIGILREHPSRSQWSAEDRTKLAADIDELVLSAEDPVSSPGETSIIMAVDQLTRIATGLRGRNSFSPPQLANALASYIQRPSDERGAEDSEEPPLGGIAGLVKLAAEASPTPNQSYLLKNMQTTIAACHASWIHDVAGSTLAIPGAWDHPFTILWYPTAWRDNNQTFGYRSAPGGGRGPYSTVTFTNARFPPDSGSISYGQKRIAQNVVVDNDAKTRLIQNASNTTVSVSYEESDDLTNSFSTNITKGLEATASVSSETSIKGTYAGVEATETITAELGVTTSSEESREKSEEGTHSESLSIEFDANPGQFYLVTISKEHQIVYQDFDIDATMDWDARFILQRDARWNPRLNQHYPGYDITITGGAEGFRQFVYGLDTNYPAMSGFMNQAYSRTKNGINCVLDAGKRRLVVSGTEQQNLESNLDYRVESLGNDLPDNLRHLPVEHADDVKSL